MKKNLLKISSYLLDTFDLGNRLVKIEYFILVIVIPLFLLVLTGDESPIYPEWQTGHFVDYLHIFLSGRVLFVFYPLIFYATLSLVLLLINYKKYLSSPVVRLGVYIGTFWCWTFVVEETLVVYPVFFSSIFVFLFLTFITKNKNKPIIMRYLTVIFLVVLLALLIDLRFRLDNFFNAIIGVILIHTPFCAAALATILSHRLAKSATKPISFRLLISLGLYSILAFVEAVFKTIYEYNQLPTTPPHCFIVTAATTGHKNIIGKNQQLFNFRRFEQRLINKHPYFHSKLRKTYNAVGPILAAKIRKNKFLADFTYFSLKPLELIIRNY